MGREVRRVPPDWQHPLENGEFKPLYKLQMPHWKNGEATHYQMYETTTAGTPISPVMETPEKLARWLVNNNTLAFGHKTASYEAWLMVSQGRTVISGVITPQSVTKAVHELPYDHDRETSIKKDDAFSKIDKATNVSRRKQQERE